MKTDVIVATDVRADRFTLRTPSSEYAEVSRRIAVPRTRFAGALAGVPETFELEGGRLELDGPFVATDTWAGPAWRTTGRLVGDGPGTRHASVELEVTGWSHAVSELRLRPLSRHFTRWGNRRQRRYFALAHHAVEQVAARVVARRPLELVTGVGALTAVSVTRTGRGAA